MGARSGWVARIDRVTTETPGAGAPFLDQLVDWRKFEDFVREIHDLDPNVVAERNVTEVGHSGAKRQIDVKLTQVLDGEPQVTLIECKRWKLKVDRQRVDVLAASVEDLGATRGVMFTTSGYEPGAEAYAKHKGIEIFVVRDLTEEEWGRPGRLVWFYLHYYAGTVQNLDLGPGELLAFVENPPENMQLNLVIGKDHPHDPSLTLHSLVNGTPGPNLASVVIDARGRALELLSRSVEAWDVEAEGETKGFLIPLELDFSDQPHDHLLRPYGALRVRRLKFDLLATVSQSRFEADRGAGLDLALAVENYVTRARQVVTRGGGDQEVRIYPLEDDPAPGDPDDPEILQNGALLKVILEAWVTAPTVKSTAPTAAVSFRLPTWDMTVTRPVHP
jgi:hypothetical protein